MGNERRKERRKVCLRNGYFVPINCASQFKETLDENDKREGKRDGTPQLNVKREKSNGLHIKNKQEEE